MKLSYDFRAYATDESDHWELADTPLAGVPVFGVYLFCEGEATHICSFTPSSRVDFLENIFLTETEEQHEEAGDWIHENGGEPGSYFHLIDAKRERRYCSEPVRVTIDSRDYDLDPEELRREYEHARRFESPQAAAYTARYRLCRDHAWEAANEEFQCNGIPSIPVLDDPREYEAHRRAKVLAEARAHERSYGPPGLFRAAGIEAPLALGPEGANHA